MLYSRNPGEEIFFSSKFFDQSEFEKKSNSILPLFHHWNRRTREHWCLGNSIEFCFCLWNSFCCSGKIFRWMEILQVWIIPFFWFLKSRDKWIRILIISYWVLFNVRQSIFLIREKFFDQWKFLFRKKYSIPINRWTGKWWCWENCFSLFSIGNFESFSSLWIL